MLPAGKASRGKVDLLSLIGVGFLLTSLVAAVSFTSNPLKTLVFNAYARYSAEALINQRERAAAKGEGPACSGAGCLLPEIIANQANLGTSGTAAPSAQTAAEQALIDTYNTAVSTTADPAAKQVALDQLKTLNETSYNQAVAINTANTAAQQAAITAAQPVAKTNADCGVGYTAEDTVCRNNQTGEVVPYANIVLYRVVIGNIATSTQTAPVATADFTAAQTLCTATSGASNCDTTDKVYQFSQTQLQTADPTLAQQAQSVIQAQNATIAQQAAAAAAAAAQAAQPAATTPLSQAQIVQQTGAGTAQPTQPAVTVPPSLLQTNPKMALPPSQLAQTPTQVTPVTPATSITLKPNTATCSTDGECGSGYCGSTGGRAARSVCTTNPGVVAVQSGQNIPNYASCQSSRAELTAACNYKTYQTQNALNTITLGQFNPYVQTQQQLNAQYGTGITPQRIVNLPNLESSAKLGGTAVAETAALAAIPAAAVEVSAGAAATGSLTGGLVYALSAPAAQVANSALTGSFVLYTLYGAASGPNSQAYQNAQTMLFINYLAAPEGVAQMINQTVQTVKGTAQLGSYLGNQLIVNIAGDRTAAEAAAVEGSNVIDAVYDSARGVWVMPNTNIPLNTTGELTPAGTGISLSTAGNVLGPEANSANVILSAPQISPLSGSLLLADANAAAQQGLSQILIPPSSNPTMATLQTNVNTSINAVDAVAPQTRAVTQQQLAALKAKLEVGTPSQGQITIVKANGTNVVLGEGAATQAGLAVEGQAAASAKLTESLSKDVGSLAAAQSQASLPITDTAAKNALAENQTLGNELALAPPAAAPQPAVTQPVTPVAQTPTNLASRVQGALQAVRITAGNLGLAASNISTSVTSGAQQVATNLGQRLGILPSTALAPTVPAESLTGPQQEIQDIVQKTNTWLKNNHLNGENIPGCRTGLCGSSSEYVSIATDLTPDLKPTIYQVRDLNAARGVPAENSFGHTVTIVEDNNGNKYLIDTTFNQFVDPATGVIKQANNIINATKDNPLVQELITNGYIPLTDQTLNEYLDLTSSGTNKTPATLGLLSQVKPSITLKFSAQDYSKIAPELLVKTQPPAAPVAQPMAPATQPSTILSLPQRALQVTANAAGNFGLAVSNISVNVISRAQQMVTNPIVFQNTWTNVKNFISGAKTPTTLGLGPGASVPDQNLVVYPVTSDPNIEIVVDTDTNTAMLSLGLNGKAGQISMNGEPWEPGETTTIKPNEPIVINGTTYSIADLSATGGVPKLTEVIPPQNTLSRIVTGTGSILSRPRIVATVANAMIIANLGLRLFMPSLPVNIPQLITNPPAIVQVVPAPAQAPPAVLQDNSLQYSLSVKDASGQNILSLPDQNTIRSGNFNITTPGGEQLMLSIPDSGVPIAVSDIRTVVDTIQKMGGLGRYLPTIELVESKNVSGAFISSLTSIDPKTGIPSVRVVVNSTGNVSSNINIAIGDALKYGKYGPNDKSLLKLAYDQIFSYGKGGTPGNYTYYNPQQVLGAGKDFDKAIGMYLVNPEELRQTSPAEFAYFEAVFKGYNPTDIQFAPNGSSIDPSEFDTNAIIHNYQQQNDAIQAKLIAQGLSNVPQDVLSNNQRYLAFAEAAAKDHNVPEEILIGVAERESGGQNGRDSLKGSAGEIGVNQVKPSSSGFTAKQLRDPATNFEASAQLLRAIYDDPSLGNGNWRDSLALYNAAGETGWPHLLTAPGVAGSDTFGYGYADTVLKNAGIDPNVLKINNPAAQVPAVSAPASQAPVPYKGYLSVDNASGNLQEITYFTQIFNQVFAERGMPANQADKTAFIQRVLGLLRGNTTNPEVVALADNSTFIKFLTSRVESADTFASTPYTNTELIQCNLWAIGVADMFPDMHIVADQYPEFSNGGAFGIADSTPLNAQATGCYSNMLGALTNPSCTGKNLQFNIKGDVTAFLFTDHGSINAGDSFTYKTGPKTGHFGVILAKYYVDGKYWFVVTEANSPKMPVDNGTPQAYLVSQDDFASRVNDLNQTYFLRLNKYNQGTTSPSQATAGVLEEINNYNNQPASAAPVQPPAAVKPAIPNAEYANASGHSWIYFSQLDYSDPSKYQVNNPYHEKVLTWANGACGIMTGAMITGMTPEEYYAEFKAAGYDLTVDRYNTVYTKTPWHLDTLQKLGYNNLKLNGNNTSLADIKVQIKNYTNQGISVWIGSSIPELVGGKMKTIPHDVEAIGVDDNGNIIVNDPVWGPNRHLSDQDLHPEDYGFEVYAIFPPSNP